MGVFATPISSILGELAIVQLYSSLTLDEFTQSGILLEWVAIEPHNLEIQVLDLADQLSHVLKLIVD